MPERPGGCFAQKAPAPFSGPQDARDEHVDTELFLGGPAVVGVGIVGGNHRGLVCGAGAQSLAEHFHRGQNPLAGLVANAAHASQTPPPDVQQIAHLDHVQTVQGVDGGGAESEFGNAGVDGRGGQQGRVVRFVAFGRAGQTAGGRAEHRLPGLEHLLGVVEAFLRVAAERSAKEFGERFAEVRVVEPLGVDRGFAFHHGRIGLAVVPNGQVSRGHLVQRDGGREPFGVQIPARRLAQGQEGIEVTGGSGPDVLGAAAGQGEIEQDQVQRIAAADGRDADVVRFDVAVGDALALQQNHRLQEIVAEPLEQIETEPALFLESRAQRLVPGLVQQQGDSIGKLKNFVAAHDQRTVQFLEHLAFVADTVVVVGIDGDLDDKLLVLPADQQGRGGGAGAELADDLVAPGQHVAGLGVDRVGRWSVVGGRWSVVRGHKPPRATTANCQLPTAKNSPPVAPSINAPQDPQIQNRSDFADCAG